MRGGAEEGRRRRFVEIFVTAAVVAVGSH